MDNIVNFPLMGEFKKEWDELVQYFAMLINSVLEKISKVEVFTAVSLDVQVDAVVGNYTFSKENVEYRLSFVMPTTQEGSYMNVLLYSETRFLTDYGFISLDDFKSNFANWFENLSIFGGE